MSEIYHVAHTLASKPYNDYSDFNVGDEIDVGSSNNPFFNYFYKTEDTISFFVNQKKYDIHYAASLSTLAKGENTVDGVEIPYLDYVYLNTKFHDLDCLNREILLENVRLQHYPHMPSRQTCLWVTKTPEEALVWLQYFVNNGDRELKLICLETSDEAFLVDSMFLPLKTDSLAQKVKKAHDYWSGNMSEKPMIEYLFRGKAKVKFISPLHH